MIDVGVTNGGQPSMSSLNISESLQKAIQSEVAKKELFFMVSP